MKKSTKRKHRKPVSLDGLYDRRDKALDRVIAAWAKPDSADEDDLDKALDRLVLAHMAATFEWASGSVTE